MTPRAAAIAAHPRIAFLGCGWIGGHRLRAAAQAGLAEIVAIADPAREAQSRVSQFAPGAALLASLDQLLELEPEGVVIATPSALHAAQAVTALERGCAVFCQKPLGRTASETEQVIAAARSADRLLATDFCYRYTKGMERIRSLVQTGELGRVYCANFVFHNAYGPDKPWFYDKVLAGGGCAMDLGIHLIDLALWVLDYPAVNAVSARLYAGGEPLAAEADRVEDFALARIDLAGGATVELACSWRLSAGRDAVIEASFYGTGGGATLRNVNGSFYDFIAERYRGTARETLTQGPEDWGARGIVEWTRRLAAGERFDREIERTAEVARVLDAIYGRHGSV
jgi:predicted dehydrogenase